MPSSTPGNWKNLIRYVCWFREGRGEENDNLKGDFSKNFFFNENGVFDRLIVFEGNLGRELMKLRIVTYDI